jgi:glucokinase
LGEQLLFKPLRCAIAQGVFRPFAPCCDVMPAALGETVVVQGALALAAERFGQ